MGPLYCAKDDDWTAREGTGGVGWALICSADFAVERRGEITFQISNLDHAPEKELEARAAFKLSITWQEYKLAVALLFPNYDLQWQKTKTTRRVYTSQSELHSAVTSGDWESWSLASLAADRSAHFTSPPPINSNVLHVHTSTVPFQTCLVSQALTINVQLSLWALMPIETGLKEDSVELAPFVTGMSPVRAFNSTQLDNEKGLDGVKLISPENIYVKKVSQVPTLRARRESLPHSKLPRTSANQWLVRVSDAAEQRSHSDEPILHRNVLKRLIIGTNHWKPLKSWRQCFVK